ncbi:MAG: thioredoxin domain-containing protein [Betaproteobacteria bacterium]
MNDRVPRAGAHLRLSPVEHVIGPSSAKVVVFEYGDFECPMCAQAYPGVKILLKHFHNRIQFAFRHFPLTEAHPHAELAAEAAEAASAQGKFWPMHDRLFENQHHLKSPALRQYAEAIGLDMNRYDAEMDDHIYLQRVQEHVASGRAAGIHSTPGFVVDDFIVDVSFGMERLFKVVEARLSGVR